MCRLAAIFENFVEYSVDEDYNHSIQNSLMKDFDQPPAPLFTVNRTLDLFNERCMR